MKLSNELVDIFEAHTGQLVCANGFFVCTKARNMELQTAASPGYRTDLVSVLFKVDFDASARFSGCSLNDLLLQGPDLNNSLDRFRERSAGNVKSICSSVCSKETCTDSTGTIKTSLKSLLSNIDQFALYLIAYQIRQWLF